ncbi:hypothetical protein NE857_09300 [Nocardiopsis exhalans]|uniref:Uncharacterized protein n=1 Tax=Nocardiopsis exhalans TaxID=163604 RepID=A0ABY5DFA1_9ACTN|nr:hypothetical protein [Nocardiopsis exhalans]USY21777.1 hypothetical protein NE857_09300 [Nocardiopsis exhalans]
MITEEYKGLEDLTDNEYEHLVKLGNQVHACRNMMNSRHGLACVDSYTEAEWAFYAACDAFNADPSEMFFELT